MKSSLRKKIGATIVALGIGVLTSVAIPISASAHTTALTATASCSADGATRTVTYTGTTAAVPDKVTATLTVDSVTPAGSKITIPDSTVTTNGGYTFTEEISGTAKSANATAHVTWGDKATASATLDKAITFTKDCTDTTTPPQCIAAVWLIAGGDKDVPFANGPQTLVSQTKSQDCTTITPPTPPTTCGTAYQIDIYNDTSKSANDITGKLLAGGKLYGANNPAESLYSNSSYSTVQNADCVTPPPTTPVTATPDVQFNDACGVSNDTYTTTAVAHITYSVKSDTRVNGVGTLIVTAKADQGYTFPDKKTTEQDYKREYTDVPCPPTTTPVSVEPAVTFDDQCGTANDTFATTPVAHITYSTKSDSIVNGSRVVVVTATADHGYTFTDGKTTTKDYTQTFTDVACPITPPTSTSIAPAVAFTDACGVTGDTITPTAADHITYDTTTGDARVNGVGTVTVTATADAGYAFPDGTTSATFTGTFTDAACAVTPPVTPPVVTPPTVAPPVVSPPVVKPIVSAPTTPSTTPRVEAPSATTPTVLASTGMNESTPIAGELALGALAIGSVLVAVGAVRRRRATNRS